MTDIAANPFQRLIEIGIALSAERDTNRLMERILLEAKDLCKADGGTLFLRTQDDALKKKKGKKKKRKKGKKAKRQKGKKAKGKKAKGKRQKTKRQKGKKAKR